MKLKLLTTAFLLTALFTLVHAQNEIEIPEECTEAAQDWYDEIDAEALSLAFYDATDTNVIVRTRLANVDTFREIADDSEVDDDSCFHQAAEWYSEALNKFADGLEQYIDGNSGDYATELLRVYLLMGQARGHLTALGVEIADPGDEIFFFK